MYKFTRPAANPFGLGYKRAEVPDGNGAYLIVTHPDGYPLSTVDLCAADGSHIATLLTRTTAADALPVLTKNHARTLDLIAQHTNNA